MNMRLQEQSPPHPPFSWRELIQQPGCKSATPQQRTRRAKATRRRLRATARAERESAAKATHHGPTWRGAIPRRAHAAKTRDKNQEPCKSRAKVPPQARHDTELPSCMRRATLELNASSQAGTESYRTTSRYRALKLYETRTSAAPCVLTSR